MSSPDAIDLGHLNRQTMGDQELAAELLALFDRQARGILADLRATSGRTAGDHKRRADLLHTLCGSARAVGAWDVATGAERLEREAREAPAAAAEPELHALDRSVASAQAAIASLNGRDLA